MASTTPRQIEDVRGSGVYAGDDRSVPADAVVRSSAALGHPAVRDGAVRGIPDVDTAALLAGRVIFGGYFLYNGLNHFVNRDALVEYARAKGVRAPGIAVAASGLMLVAGAASILAGARPKVGACLISTFLAGVSPVMHAFWKEREPAAHMQEMVNFTKNVALIGACLIAAAHPEPWPWHVEPRAGGALVPVPTR
jgi:putative oxidoreductase